MADQIGFHSSDEDKIQTPEGLKSSPISKSTQVRNFNKVANNTFSKKRTVKFSSNLRDKQLKVTQGRMSIPSIEGRTYISTPPSLITDA